jgi:hypothetical protein
MGAGVAATASSNGLLPDRAPGLRRGPTVSVPFSQKVWFQDFMGCFR